MSIDINELQEALEGTCDSLQGGIEAVLGDDSDYELTIEEHEQLDQLIFLCDECSWWCCVSERNGDDICDDCSENSED